MDFESFYQTRILDKEGGTCIDTNYLFSWLLTQLGYKTKFFAAHFYIEETKEWSEFYGHCFLVVRASGTIYNLCVYVGS